MMLRDLLRAAWPRKNSYSRDVAYTAVGNAFTAALAIVSGILLARALGPVGRGQLLAIQAFPMLLASIGMLGLQDAIVYRGARERERVGEYGVSATVLIVLLGIPIVFAAFWVVPLFLRSHTAEVVFTSRIYLSILFLNALMGFSLFTVRALHDMPRWNLLRVLPQTVWVLVIVTLFLAGSADPHRIATSYLMAYFVLGCLSLLALRGPLRGARVNPALWGPLLRYSLPLAAGSTPMFLGIRVDQLIIAALLPAEQLGYYAVAVSWSSLMLLPGEALFGVAFSKISGMDRPAAQWAFAQRATWASVAASLATGAALALAAPWVIPFAFGQQFVSAISVAVVLVLAGALRNVARMLQSALKGCGKPSGVMYSEWGGVVVMLGGFGVLVPRYGLTGAAWAVVLSCLGTTLIAWVMMRRWAAGIEKTAQ